MARSRIAGVVSLVVLAACDAAAPTQPEGVPRGGWDGTNCMGGSYATTLLDDNNQLLTVGTRTAVAEFADDVQLTVAQHPSGAFVFDAEAAKFEAVGLDNWFQKLYQVLLPEGLETAGHDAHGELVAGHYDVGEVDVCGLAEGPYDLAPDKRDLVKLFLYALVQQARCPSADHEDEFAAVDVVLLRSGETFGLDELVRKNVVRAVPAGQPASHPCLIGHPVLWDPVVVVTAGTGTGTGTGTGSGTGSGTGTGSGSLARVVGDQVCDYELGRLEAVVTLATDFQPTLTPSMVRVPVSFAGTDSLEGMEVVRHFLRSDPEAVGVVTGVRASESCAIPVFPCPYASRRVRIDGFDAVTRLNTTLSATVASTSQAAAFQLGYASPQTPALAVLLPWGSRARCMLECPPNVPGLEAPACD